MQTKITIQDILNKKQRGEKITMLTVYFNRLHLLFLFFIVSMFFSNQALAQESQDYFPKSSWIFNYTGENDLPITGRKCDEVYRLFIQPMGYISDVIRIEQRGDKYLLFVKKGQNSGPSPKFVETTKVLTQKDWQEFIRLLNLAEFWKMPVLGDNRIGMDGVTFILEGVKGDKYRFVKRWSPGKDSFLKVCDYLKSISASK